MTTPLETYSLSAATQLEALETNSLTLYFHGGLVSEQAALEQAQALLPEFAENAQSHPIFVLWKAGLVDTLESALLNIVATSPLFVEVLRKVLKHAARKMSAAAPALDAGPNGASADPNGAAADTNGAAADPATRLRALLEADQLPLSEAGALHFLEPHAGVVDDVTDAEARALEDDLAADQTARRALNAIIDQVRKQPVLEAMGGSGLPVSTEQTGWLSASLLAELAAAQAPAQGASSEPGIAPLPPPGVEAELIAMATVWAFAARILRAVVGRYRAGTDHGLLATALEEIYRAMYADQVAGYLWGRIKSSAEKEWTPLTAGVQPAAQPAPGGTLLVQWLHDQIARRGSLSLHLVGHSAGALHVCYFVERAAEIFGDDLHIDSIALLAPACTCDLFDRTIVRHARSIDSVRIFAMSDALERRDPLTPWLPLAYPHSLLYFISGLLEDDGPDTPIMGMARHVKPRLSASAPGDGAAAHAAKHVRDWLAEDSTRLVLASTAVDAPAGLRATFTAHYGEHGPVRDRATLDSVATQIRPAPLEGLQPLEVDVTKEAALLLRPSATIALAAENNHAPGGGGLTTDELIAAQLGGVEPSAHEVAPAGGDLESALLEAIIGENEIIDHALLKGLLLAGRSVARVVVSGVQGLFTTPPEQRAQQWKQAEQAGALIQGYGTGWIFGRARRLLITNNHVIPLPEAARTASAEFGYERDLRTGARAQQVLKLAPDEFFLTSPNMAFGGLDYTLVALSRQAPEELGYLEPVQGITAARTANVFIVQHPRGDPKAYVLNHNRKVNLTDRYLTYVSDTLEGSSGSPLLDDSLRLVGIHHVGNYTVQIGGRDEQTNLGSRIEAVVADIVAQLRAAHWEDDKIEQWIGVLPVTAES